MGKGFPGTRHKDAETKVLFKKSNATFFTHSRTCSGASQLYSRSGILQIKKNLENNQKHSYYNDRGKVKRDLSIETDVCILRRYYRIKKNKMSNQGSSAKSKYSTLVDTEVETIEEFPDNSACGDNETSEVKSYPPPDIASLMIDNLKDLLNQWIQKHLIHNNNGTKPKIDSVLDCLMHQLDTKNNLACSSGSTYVLHREAISQEVKNKKVATASLICQHCKHKGRQTIKVETSSNESPKSSSLTIPFEHKDVRIISTLSIPRSFHKSGTDDKKSQNSSCYKMRKIKHKNIILSIDKSNKIVSSSFDLVAISTKSLSKRCVNYDMNVKKKKRHIVFFPKPFYKSATDTSSTTNNEHFRINSTDMNNHQLDDMPSLLKSLYANDPAVITNLDTSNEYETTQDNSTMTESQFKTSVQTKKKSVTDKQKNIFVNKTDKKISDKKNDKDNSSIAFDYIKQNIEFPNIDLLQNSLDSTKHKKFKGYNNFMKYSTKGKIDKRRRLVGNKKSPTIHPNKFQSIYNKHFSFRYKNTNSEKQESDFLKHCQNILQYFTDFNVNKNIKLDVCINVFPMYANGAKDVCTDTSNPTLGIYNDKGEPTIFFNVEPNEEEPQERMDESLKDNTEHDNSSIAYTPEIIPLLDGAVSQTKYIFSVSSRDKIEVISKPNSYMERSTLTSELEIVQEISELRAVIKDLAAAAEKFVNEHWKKESRKSNAETTVSRNLSHNFTSSSKCEAVINLRNPSKAIQYSKEFAQNQKIQSGLKITKEPKKKDAFEYYNRLAKKSTSYRIIDSESILKITDMTSKANEFSEYNKCTDNALTCSLPKSRSLFEMTSDNRTNRKLIALFCDGCQKHPPVCSVCRNLSPASSSAKPTGKKWFGWPKCGKKDCPITPSDSPSPQSPTRTASPMQHKPLRTSSSKVQNCRCKSNSQSSGSCVVPILPDEYGGYATSSTICFPPDEELEEEEPSVETLRKCCKERRGMGFGEGCVYCMLLWIPVIIIAVLFYGYVIRDKIKFPESKKTIGRQSPITKPLGRNGSVLYVKLSDLGF